MSAEQPGGRRRRKSQPAVLLLLWLATFGCASSGVPTGAPGSAAEQPAADGGRADGGIGADAEPTVAAQPPPPAVVTPAPYPGWVDPASVGEPWGSVPGVLTFRGNPTRTFYGTGPIPTLPGIRWRFGEVDELCSFSKVGQQESKWCGTGWTGQPAVFDFEGRRWVVFGSYAPAVHFLDADSGDRIIPDFPVGDLIKGSVTIDPDGFPFAYIGSRDGFFRIISFEGDEPTEIWSLDADTIEPSLWNNDWDGTGVVLDDYLFVGGENSNFHIIKLNRSHDATGRATAAPELLHALPGWDDELLADIGDENVSIETSVTVSGDLAWFANSGGLVQAWDISGVKAGQVPERVLRFWTGDDTDASIVIDADGFAYVGVELERANSRAVETGQIVKLDPRQPEDPIVWSRDLHVRVPDGVWATPALHRDVIYVPTNEGFLHSLDAATGETRWRIKLQGPVWSSPIVVDDVLLQADCAGLLHAYDVSDTSVKPAELWSLQLPWCVESTPAVYDGGIYVGHRRGEVWAIEEREP